MTANSPESLVLVYTSASPFEAEVVKGMLAEEEIASSVENENSPFPGLGATACKVYVTARNEALARQLIEEHEAQHRQRMAAEESGDESGQDRDYEARYVDQETTEFEVYDGE